MIPLNKAYMLSKDTILDNGCMAEMMHKSYSRVPVFDKHPHNVCGRSFMLHSALELSSITASNKRRSVRVLSRPSNPRPHPNLNPDRLAARESTQLFI